MNVGVVVFPGSNCDDDMMHVMGQVMACDTHKIWHKESDLSSYGKLDCIVVPGGFSYGDYLRSGAIARYSPVMQEVTKFANQGGFVFGICNGFQVLTEAQLLPGVLLRNKDQKFICQNVYLKTETSNSAITNKLQKEEVIKIPIAHADGRYFADDDTIKSLNDHDQVLFRYCDKDGNKAESVNVNGSVQSIAGIMNKQRNVFGMMPHPERASEEALGNTQGKKLFESLLAYLN